jgi:hypothetical protein
MALVLLLKPCYTCTFLICKFCIVSPQKALGQLHTFRTRSFTSGGNSQKGSPGPGPNPGPGPSPSPTPDPGSITRPEHDEVYDDTIYNNKVNDDDTIKMYQVH